MYHWNLVVFVEQMKGMGLYRITFDGLKRIATSATDANINKHLNGINLSIKECDIDSGLKIAHFLAQVIHESGSFLYSAEIGASDSDYGGIKDRGLMQVTWEESYKKYGEFVGEDVATPERPEHCLEPPPR